ncbi:hypothetical protein TorRG33x02_191580 [Trema orientale]|uniref:Uncharacterized protein n=1 Tax=Trema orientale TaxID=63057 RepID=A0A2P5EHN7_TREOI|nr:hypothetical protein TorRG33x02_191580 [Trema orientale]
MSLVMVIGVPGTLLFSESIEEIDTKKNIEQVHSSHPKQGQWQFYTLFKFGSIQNELGRDENVSCKPCCNEGNPVENPFYPYDYALGITKSSHPPDFPHV